MLPYWTRVSHDKTNASKSLLGVLTSEEQISDTNKDSSEAELSDSDSKPVIYASSARKVKSTPDLAQVVGYTNDIVHNSESPVRLMPLMRPEYKIFISPIEVKTEQGFDTQHGCIQVAFYARRVKFSGKCLLRYCCVLIKNGDIYFLSQLLQWYI